MIKKKIALNIGDYYVSRDPAVISTILGSCVAVCLIEPQKKIGGMNHIQMPGRTELKNSNKSGRYSENAIKMILDAMIKLGADREKIVAKIFGGASVIPIVPDSKPIGPEIIRLVEYYLCKEKIKIINSDLGGIQTRKVYFHTDTGNVFIKKTGSMKSACLNEEES